MAGATRGAGRGTARALGAAGAFVYCTGRSAIGHPQGMGRQETIDETVDLVRRDGGDAVALRVDHTREAEVERLASMVRERHGRLDILVNSVWGGDPLIDWSKRFWEIDTANLEAVASQTLFSHIRTNRHLTPLLIEADHGLLVEMIDGHFEGYRGHVIYDLVKAALARLAYGMALELVPTRVTALSLSPGFLRSEAVLDHFGVNECNWRDAIAKDPYFAESESPRLSGRAIVALATDPNVKKKAGLVTFASDLAREYGFTDVDGRVPDFPRALDASLMQLATQPELSPDRSSLAWIRYCQIHRDPSRHELVAALAKMLRLPDLGPALGPARVTP